ncbi:hypothetical protein [Rhodococcus sp. X156]|uniref:hypothetical protein n=1 Tax=Rhodococcus sp. X156 TaxID=2499145 RepID=UPI000FDC900F|nr:hypothetical protein [Rhodococcus sp. X156]
MNSRTAAALGLNALYLASQTFIGRRLGPMTKDLFRLQLTTSAPTFRSIVDGWDEGQLARYRSHLPPDMVHPVIYGCSLTASTLKLDELVALPPRVRTALLVAPWVAAACDYAENVAHLYLLDHREAITPPVITATGVASTTKWALAGSCVVTLAAGYARAGWRAAHSSR